MFVVPNFQIFIFACGIRHPLSDDPVVKFGEDFKEFDVIEVPKKYISLKNHFSSHIKTFAKILIKKTWLKDIFSNLNFKSIT